VVNFAYGRRGSSLQTATKASSPVDLEAATKIFTNLINEKKAKGYTEGEAGTRYQHTVARIFCAGCASRKTSSAFP
jgi:bifunctional non-homologous end joining protein LigD